MDTNSYTIDITEHSVREFHPTPNNSSFNSPFDNGQDCSTSSNLQVTAKAKRPRRTRMEIEAARALGINSKSKISSHFTDIEYSRICSYIENEDRYNELFGGGKRTKVNGNVISQVQAFENFAQWMNSMRQKYKNNGVDLTGESLRQRFKTYKKKYEKARLLSTGDGINDSDIARGLITIDLKQQDMCPQFQRMDAIFSKKANVVAMDEFDSCINNLASLGNCEDSLDHNNIVETISQSQNMNTIFDEREIFDVDADIGIDAEVNDDDPFVLTPPLLIPTLPSPDPVSPPVETSFTTTTLPSSRPNRRKRKQPINLSTEDIRPKEHKNTIALAFERQTDIRAQHESQTLAWEKERHKDDRLYNEQREARYEAERLCREKSRREEKEEIRKRRRIERLEDEEREEIRRAKALQDKRDYNEKKRAYADQLLKDGHSAASVAELVKTLYN